jgi:hypothetical protein
MLRRFPDPSGASVFTAFDRITIEVPKLAEACTHYGQLLGELSASGDLLLGNVGLALREVPGLERARIASLGLLDPGLPGGASEPLDAAGQAINLERSHTRDGIYREQPTATGIYAVDHLVLQTRDADACIALFRDELELRLALDQTVPEFGGRMLFFRHGKMTLEVIQNLERPPEQDFFWGITYLCRDIDTTIEELDRRGVAHSPIRQGRKPGTRVSTVKSHCLGLPTLLIGPA